MEKSKRASLTHSEAITTRKETLQRGDEEAYMALIRKRFLLQINI